MQALKLPARRGVRWLAEGFALFRRQPGRLSLLVLTYWLSMAVISAIPMVGQLLSFLLIPAFSVSLMNACRQIETSGDLPPRILFSGFHHNLQTLLTLGAIYVALTFVVLGLSVLFDGGLLFRLLVLGETPSRDALGDGSATASSLFVLAMLMPVIMAFWFAPVLAAWHDMSAGKALFFSLIASLRNWRAFAVYALTVAAIALIVPRLIALLGGGEAHMLSTMLTVMLSLVLLPTLYASFYVSYRDVFAAADAH